MEPKLSGYNIYLCDFITLCYYVVWNFNGWEEVVVSFLIVLIISVQYIYIYLCSLMFQVRTLEVKESSSEKIRNFEYNCLGEVRILSTLKHPCIVEMYGHQISYKWILSEDGNPDHCVLRSAIFMEYMEGGSLRVSLLIFLVIVDNFFSIEMFVIFPIHIQTDLS